MSNNIFEHFQEQKGRLLSFASKAHEYGWIDDERERQIQEKLNSDILTIGVIGQMKCGKSTFLNAFVFENDILPAATTPMTAALSVITYGEEPGIIAEFYTKDEWLEQKMLASQSIEGLSDFEASKIKAAKELVGKSGHIQNDIENYLGKTQKDDLNNIIEYVGADGKFVSITKAVKIFYPKEYLKGVEIVDTPGFNDPIVSRELRTKEFLKKADVVVMMLYAGRPFDNTDRTILFENVKQCGIGKVLIGVNKYDIPYEKGDMPDAIKQYVVEQLKEESRQCHDESLLDILKTSDPILLSAEMGLLSELPMEKITSNERYHHAFTRYAKELGISGQSQLREMSRMDALADAIKKMVEQEKYDVLLKKPLNAIFAAGSKQKEDLELSLSQVGAEIKVLNSPEDELEEKELNLSKAEKRLERKIEGLGDDLNLSAKEIARRGKNDLVDALDSCCKKLEQVVDNVGRFGNFENIGPRLDQIFDEFNTRTSKRIIENLAGEMKRKIVSVTRDFYLEAEEILAKYLPETDSREFVKEIERCVNIDIEDDSIFKPSDSESEEDTSLFDVIGEFFYNFLKGATFGGAELILRGINHNEVKNKILSNINSIRTNFNPQPYVDTITNSKDNVVSTIKDKFMNELIKPLQEMVSEFREHLDERESRLAMAQQKRDELQNRVREINEQISTMKAMM